MSKDYKIIPIFVPHEGCPFDCVFCNQKKITGVNTSISSSDLKNIIEISLKTIPVNSNNLEIAFYGGSFTGIDMSVQKELLEIAFAYKKSGLVDRIRLSTRPDYIDTERLDLLKAFGVDIVELGVQSLADEVLLKSNRGHNSQDVYKAVYLLKEYNFTIGLQMMIGLPGDNPDYSINTAKRMITLEPDFVRIYPTLVIKDTQLEKLFFQQDYTPLTLNESVKVIAEILMLFQYYKIQVIRVGLQPTDNISLGNDLISGPFHPSFKQITQSYIYRIIIEDYLKKRKIESRDMMIEGNHKEISNIVGQRRFNKRYLKQNFNLEKIQVRAGDMGKDNIYITINGHSEEVSIRNAIETYLRKRNLLLSVEYKSEKHLVL